MMMKVMTTTRHCIVVCLQSVISAAPTSYRVCVFVFMSQPMIALSWKQTNMINKTEILHTSTRLYLWISYLANATTFGWKRLICNASHIFDSNAYEGTTYDAMQLFVRPYTTPSPWKRHTYKGSLHHLGILTCPTINGVVVDPPQSYKVVKLCSCFSEMLKWFCLLCFEDFCFGMFYLKLRGGMNAIHFVLVNTWIWFECSLVFSAYHAFDISV